MSDAQVDALVQKARASGASEMDISLILDRHPAARERSGVQAAYPMPDQVTHPELMEWVPYGAEFDSASPQLEEVEVQGQRRETVYPPLEEVEVQSQRRETVYPPLEEVEVQGQRRETVYPPLEEVEVQGQRREMPQAVKDEMNFGGEWPTPSDMSPTAPAPTGDTPQGVGMSTGGRVRAPETPAPVGPPTPHEVPPLGGVNVREMPDMPEELTFSGLHTLWAGGMKYGLIPNAIREAYHSGKRFMMEDDPQYSAFDDMSVIAGRDYSLFKNSRSAAETALIMEQNDQDIMVDAMLERTGWQGTMSAMGGGVVNPLYAMPYIGVGARIAKAGSVTKTGFKVGMAEGIAGELLTEAYYHGFDADTTRGVDESVFNVTAGAIMGGTLGWLLKSRAITPEEYSRLVDTHSKHLKDIGNDKHSNPIDTLETADDIERMSFWTRQAAKLTPVRILASENPLARKLGALIGEQNIVNTQRAAIETLIKKYDGPLYQGVSEMRGLWRTHRTNGGTMKYGDFQAEVAAAMRNGDVHSIPEVEHAAKIIRRDIMDPIEKAAKELGLLKDGDFTKYAASYFPRQYNFGMIDSMRGQFVDDIANWLRGVEGMEKFSAADLKEAGREILRSITGSKQTSLTKGVDIKVKALQDRKVPIPDNVLSKYLINDPEEVLRSWTHDMATAIEMRRMFGEKGINHHIEQVDKHWDTMIEQASREGNEKMVHKWSKRKDDDNEVLNALKDRLENRYGLPDNQRNTWVRAARVGRNLNILRLLGGMTLSAFADMARPLYKHHFGRYGKALTELTTNADFRKIAVADMRRLGIGVDMVTAGRLRAISEAEYVPQRLSRFEHFVERLISGGSGGQMDFGKMTLMTPWNSSLKTLSGIMSQDGLIAHLTKNQKFAKKLAKAGIPEEMVTRMKAELKAHGTNESGLRFGNSDKWADTEAAELFEATILREVEATIVTPGILDKPLWMSSEVGKTLGQFKSFGFAATNKQTLAAMNEPDILKLQGMLASISLGVLSYQAKNALGGRELETDPGKLLLAGIEKSGVTGMGMEAFGMGLGLGQAAGVYKGEGSSMWAKQGVIGQIGGPSLGLAEDVMSGPRAFFSDEPAASDIESVRRLMPYNNLHVLSLLFQRAEKAYKDRHNILE